MKVHFFPKEFGVDCHIENAYNHCVCRSNIIFHVLVIKVVDDLKIRNG